MSDKVYDVPAEWAKRAWVNARQIQGDVQALGRRSRTGFWAEHGKRIDWFTPFTKVKNTSFDAHNVSIKWFEDGVTNVAPQLHRSASAQAGKPDRDHLGRRRPVEVQAHHLRGACSRRSGVSPTC